MLITYINKIKKANPPKKDLPLLKNDIPNNLKPQKPVVYSRCVVIADIQGVGLKISKLNRSDFMASIFQGERQSLTFHV